MWKSTWPSREPTGRRRIGERAGVGPEPRRVEGGDVAAPLLRRGQLGGQRIGVGALAHEVVAGLAGRARSHPGHALLVVRQGRVEQHHPVHPARDGAGPGPGRRDRRGRRPRARRARDRACRGRARSRSRLCDATSWSPSGPTSLSPKPRRSGTITSKPAAARGSITFQKIALGLGPPVDAHERARRPAPRARTPGGSRGATRCATGKRVGSMSGRAGHGGTLESPADEPTSCPRAPDP